MSKFNLSPLEVGVLVLSPYAYPRKWAGAEQRTAHKLVKRGLLEQDPTAPAVFRQTEEGAAVVAQLVKEGVA